MKILILHVVLNLVLVAAIFVQILCILIGPVKMSPNTYHPSAIYAVLCISKQGVTYIIFANSRQVT